MISAAVLVLRNSGRLDAEADGADERLVLRMLQAAFDAIPGRQKHRGENSDAPTREHID